MKATEAKTISDQEPARRLKQYYTYFLKKIKFEAECGEYCLKTSYDLSDENFIKEKVVPTFIELGYKVQFIDGVFEAPKLRDTEALSDKEEVKKMMIIMWGDANGI